MKTEVLICDEPDCDHVEDVGTITAHMVGWPCPMCGANLLTQADWQDYQAMTKLVDGVQDVLNDDGNERVLLQLHVHNGRNSMTVTNLPEGHDGTATD